MNFCVVEDGKIYYNPILTKPNDLDHEIDFKDMLTPCGFFIPLDYHAMAIFDALTGSFEDLCPATVETTVGILLDHQARLYEVVLTTKNSNVYLSRRRVIVGQVGYVRTFGYTEQEKCYMFARFLGTPTLDSLKEVFFEHYPLHKRAIQYADIKEIVQDLKGYGYTNPFPRKLDGKT